MALRYVFCALNIQCVPTKCVAVKKCERSKLCYGLLSNVSGSMSKIKGKKKLADIRGSKFSKNKKRRKLKIDVKNAPTL